MLLRSLLAVTLLASTSAMANTLYIGDSIAEGYKIYNKGNGYTQVGANPEQVLKFVNTARYANYTKVVLSSGISNNCHGGKIVKAQLFKLSLKAVNVVLLSNNNCPGANEMLKAHCAKFANCKFEYIPSSKDGVHPQLYNKRF